MSTIFTPRIVVATAPNIAAVPAAMKELREGLANAEAASGHAELESLWDEDFDRASHAWERVVADAAADEIAPLVAEMLRAAIAKRLPWTWERER
jgi:hypothetical protein